MTIEDLKNTIELTEKQKQSVRESEQSMSYWHKVENYTEFLESVKNDEFLKCEKITADLFKGNWYFLRHQLGDKSIKTISDAGTLRIGVDGLGYAYIIGMAMDLQGAQYLRVEIWLIHGHLHMY